jgi:hypothetical protein
MELIQILLAAKLAGVRNFQDARFYAIRLLEASEIIPVGEQQTKFDIHCIYYLRKVSFIVDLHHQHHHHHHLQILFDYKYHSKEISVGYHCSNDFLNSKKERLGRIVCMCGEIISFLQN